MLFKIMFQCPQLFRLGVQFTLQIGYVCTFIPYISVRPCNFWLPTTIPSPFCAAGFLYWKGSYYKRNNSDLQKRLWLLLVNKKQNELHTTPCTYSCLISNWEALPSRQLLHFCGWWKFHEAVGMVPCQAPWSLTVRLDWYTDLKIEEKTIMQRDYALYMN